MNRAQLEHRHRSFRAAPPFPSAIFTSLALPVLLTWFFFRYAPQLLAFHERLRTTFLTWCQIPILRFVPTSVLHGAFTNSAVTSVANYEGRAWLPWVSCAVVAAMVGVAFAFFKLSRGIAGCAVALLLISAIWAAVYPNGVTESTLFVSFWLKCEFLVWMLLPWLMALLTAFVVSNGFVAALCTLAAPVYGLVWSAARLTLCAGILSISGPVLEPFLWFSLGLLADVLYLCTFYSFAVYFHSGRDQTGRAS